MKEIKPTYVSFSQAKALKEKSINIECKFMYGCQVEPQLEPYNETRYNIYKNYTSAPEQWQVVEWLFKTKKIWISTKISFMGKFESEIYTKDSSGYFVRRYDFDSMKTPQEAISAAVDYVLEKLI